MGHGAVSFARRTAGFSLPELMVTLGVCGTLASIAVPSWQSATHSMRLTAISNAFTGHLQLARSEAIKRNTRVVVCKSADGASCSGSGDWEQGWIVFHDANNDGVREAGEQLLEAFQALPSGYRFSGNSPVASYVSYSPVGPARTVSGAFQAGTLTLCRSGGPAEAREIAINALGRPKVRKASLTAC